MAKYSIEFPTAVVDAIKEELGEDGEGLTGKNVVVKWLQRELESVARAYRRRALGDPTDEVAAREAAEAALVTETTARADAEAAEDVKATADAQGVV